MFIDYCLNKNYIDKDIYEKELYTIYTKNKIGNALNESSNVSINTSFNLIKYKHN